MNTRTNNNVYILYIIILNCLLSLLCCSIVYANDTNSNDDNNNDNNNICRLYLGPSYLTSDTNNKFGLYAGINYNVNDIIPSYEIGFPLYDLLNKKKEKNSKIAINIIKNLETIMWTTDHSGGQSKWESNSSTLLLIPGIGILINYHSGIYNVDWYQKSIIQRKPYIETYNNIASRGVISPYYNFTLRATKPIPIGMELYGHYGNYHDNEQTITLNNDIYQDKIVRNDYEITDEIIQHIINYFNQFQTQYNIKNNIMNTKYNDTMSIELQNTIYKFMITKILNTIAGKRSKVYKSLLPINIDELYNIQNNYSNSSFYYRNNDIIKSKQWLQKHALCVDNLYVNTSTINVHAGRGAFINKKIKKNDIISPIPLIPILTDEIFELYYDTQNDNNNDENSDDDTKPTTFQQLLNYVYGHPESTLHFIPVAPIVNYINHGPLPDNENDDLNNYNNSTVHNKNGIKTANAYLTWSLHEHIYNDYNIQDIPINEWNINEIPSIVMNLIALRDIEPNEEILINYGNEWEYEWNNYMLYWQYTYNNTNSNRPIKWPLKAQDTRELYINHTSNTIKPYPINILQGMTPYPYGIVTACYLINNPIDVPDGYDKKNSNGHDILIWQGNYLEQDNSLIGHTLVICDLLNRIPIYDTTSTDNKTNKNYNNIISYNYTILTRIKDENNIYNIVQIEYVPHYAITLIDRPYTSDIHIQNSFRHWIGINDKIFPQAWRNLR